MKRDANTSFFDQVMAALMRIPRGRVSTYALLAKAIGHPGAARAVGNALNKNPHAPRVPCHRIVCSDGRLGGYASGAERKIELLREEGVEMEDGRIVDFEELNFKFK